VPHGVNLCQRLSEQSFCSAPLPSRCESGCAQPVIHDRSITPSMFGMLELETRPSNDSILDLPPNQPHGLRCNKRPHKLSTHVQPHAAACHHVHSYLPCAACGGPCLRWTVLLSHCLDHRPNACMRCCASGTCEQQRVGWHVLHADRIIFVISRIPQISCAWGRRWRCASEKASTQIGGRSTSLYVC
jgi:hypothetical protein